MNPCPFCGRPAFGTDVKNVGTSFAVECSGCHAVGSWKGTYYDALHAWNARVLSDMSCVAMVSAQKILEQLKVSFTEQLHFKVEDIEEALRLLNEELSR